MSDCCSSHSEEKPKSVKCDCPVCKQKSLSVSMKTMLHHIVKSWKYSPAKQQYYFCSDPDCEVVYFSVDGLIINKNNVRTRIGAKEKSENTLICYCFGISKAEAKEEKDAKEFAIKQTKESVCSCDIENPSGRCCLKAFPKS